MQYKQLMKKRSLFLGFAVFFLTFFVIGGVQQASAASVHRTWKDTDNIGYLWPHEAKIVSEGELWGYTDYFYIPGFPRIYYGGVSSVQVDWRAYAPDNLGWNSFRVDAVKVQVEVWDGNIGSGDLLYDSGYIDFPDAGGADCEDSITFNINKSASAKGYLKVWISVWAQFTEYYYHQDGSPPDIGRTVSDSNNEFITIDY